MSTAPPAPHATRHQVVLVREWHDHHGAGGCCGNVDAIRGLVTDRSATDCDVPAGGLAAGPGDRTGALYRALRADVPEVDVTIADSRNWLWLVPSTYRAQRRGGAGRTHAATAAARSTTPGAVLVDGTLLALPDGCPPEQVVRAVRTAVAARDAGDLPGGRDAGGSTGAGGGTLEG
jgi:hypothetical protein